LTNAVNGGLTRPRLTPVLLDRCRQSAESSVRIMKNRSNRVQFDERITDLFGKTGCRECIYTRFPTTRQVWANGFRVSAATIWEIAIMGIELSSFSSKSCWRNLRMASYANADQNS
jgi:hypothetical protein